MRLRGIHYDVGIPTIEGTLTRPTLTLDEIERDIGDTATACTRMLSASLAMMSHDWRLPARWQHATDLRSGCHRCFPMPIRRRR